MLSLLGGWAVAVLSSLGGWFVTVLGSWVAAASTGAIAAWVLSFVRDRWSRPKLKVEIELKRSPVVEDQTTDGARTKYARLIVRNQGRTLAKNCCAYIDYIKRTDPTAPRLLAPTRVQPAMGTEEPVSAGGARGSSARWLGSKAVGCTANS